MADSDRPHDMTDTDKDTEHDPGPDPDALLSTVRGVLDKRDHWYYLAPIDGHDDDLLPDETVAVVETPRREIADAARAELAEQGIDTAGPTHGVGDEFYVLLGEHGGERDTEVIEGHERP